MRESYPIPKEIKSEIKLKWGFFLKDLFVIAGFAMWGYATSGMFAGEIFPFLYVLVNVILGIYLIMKPAGNPKKRNYQMLWLILNMDRQKYHSFNLEKSNRK